MSMKDIHSHMAVVSAIGPAVIAADATATDIDLAGFYGAEIVILAGVGGITFDATNKIEIKVRESNDGTTYTSVAANDILGGPVASGGIVKAFNAAHAAAAAYRFGYVGNKRYLEIVADFAGTHGTGTPLAIVVIKGRPSDTPVANQA